MVGIAQILILSLRAHRLPSTVCLCRLPPTPQSQSQTRSCPSPGPCLVLVAVLQSCSHSPQSPVHFRILSTAYPSLPRRPVVPPPVCCPQCVKVQTLSRQIRAKDTRLSQIISPRVKHSPARPPQKCHLPRDPLINWPWSSSNRTACSCAASESPNIVPPCSSRLGFCSPTPTPPRRPAAQSSRCCYCCAISSPPELFAFLRLTSLASCPSSLGAQTSPFLPHV